MLTLLNANFISNGGAGLSNIGGVVYVTNTRFIGNEDGGIRNNSVIFPPSTSLGRMTVTNVTISDNSAVMGAGIYNGGVLTVTNTTLSRNTATGTDSYGGGGAIATEMGSLKIHILNSTIVSNTAAAPNEATSGLWLQAGPVTMKNSILAFNGPDGLSNLTTQPWVSFSSLGHNLTNGTGPFTATGDLISTNPLLGPLQINPPGAALPTHALLPGSPAFDAADDAACPLTDQRGVKRPIGAHCDIGAFELFNVHQSLFVPVVTR